MEVDESAVQGYLARPHDVIIYPDVLEDGSTVYVSLDPDLSGCMSDGTTPEAAAANLEDARALYVRGLLARGIPLPERVSFSSGTMSSYRSVSVILSCCEPVEPDVPELQRIVFDLPVMENALHA